YVDETARVFASGQASSSTLIQNVGGAQGQPVRLGTIKVTVDGEDLPLVDLSSAATLVDVKNAITQALTQAGDQNISSIDIITTGFSLHAGYEHTLTISDYNGGQTAADLGINKSVSDDTISGADIHPLGIATAYRRTQYEYGTTGGVNFSNDLL